MSVNKYIGFHQMKQIVANNQPTAQVSQLFSLLNMLDYSHLNAQDSNRIVENLKEVPLAETGKSFSRFCEKLFNTINQQKPEFIDLLSHSADEAPGNTLAKKLSDNLSLLKEKHVIDASVSSIPAKPSTRPSPY